MTAPAPDDALARLAELSSDVRAAILMDGAGKRLAGDRALAGPAAELLGATDAAAVEVMTERGAVFAARSSRHALAVVTSRFALPSLVLYDLRQVLAELELAAS